MLGIYVHTHWAYNHPYAARTWTLEDWTGFMAGLKAIGYDTVMIWPQNETMPVPPTPSDAAFLEKLRRVIDLAHDSFGMKVLIVNAPNVFFNEKSAGYTFETRYFWEAARNIDPKDRAGVEAMMSARSAQYEYFARADGLVIIDADPGGWPDSPPEDFIEFFRLQGEAMRKLNQQSTIYYWMWQGWPHTMSLSIFREILSGMKKRITWPWQILSCTETHLEATDEIGLADRRTFFPYNLVEYEPVFPLTNANPAWVRQEMKRYDPQVYPGGVMFNAQTHCLQLPRMYLAAHYARGGTRATEKLMVFAEKLIPGEVGVRIGTAWLYLEDERDTNRMRFNARQLRKERVRSHQPGPLADLMMMPPEQFMLDLADNLDIRADFIDLRIAIESGRELKKVLRHLLGHLRPYRERHGYNHICWEGPLRKRVFDLLVQLGDPKLDAAIWPAPGTNPGPEGYLVNVFNAIEAFANSL